MELVLRALLIVGIFLGMLGAENTADLQAKLNHLQHQLETSDNIWLKKFKNFESYGRISVEIQKIQERLKKLQEQKGDPLEISALKHSLQALQHQEKLLDLYKTHPFKDLVEKPAITNMPNVTSPLGIIGALSFIKSLKIKYTTMQGHQKSLHQVLDLLTQELEILKELQALQPKKWATPLYQEQIKIIEFSNAQSLLKASLDTYAKDIQEADQSIKDQIKDQLFKLLYVLLVVLCSVLLAWGLKKLSHKYLYDDERSYSINKAINFINANVIVLIFLFSYLENVSYLVTAIGFMGAGFAIAMRDLFMSVLGWMTLILRGNLHVGDRVQVSKDGNTYVGDVLDISMLYTTIFEDVTITTYIKNNGRAGRIIFVPNNYIFTGLLSNCSHLGSKTIWDSLEFFLTFDSNHQKAIEIATQIATTNAQSYSQMAQAQFSKMRTKYAFRNVDASPKVFIMPEKDGMRLFISYLADAYNALPLRSAISLQILQAFLKSKDIFVSASLKPKIEEDTEPKEPSPDSPASPLPPNPA
ncbi:mechanosensitive ion channel family protein [Helicobacter bizzozeronii]|uniref:mechanosensitive ion channel family protein n=1 Tax=Helicobacter bizzozeronii TaxID=56877 RepID=UPI001F1FBBAA|nr:mechanosensitive ion channel domain-containing protein [Helicobacter bizzozeronii]